MINLQQYINNLISEKSNMEIDGHIHLFNYKEPISLSLLPYKKYIGFMDIEFDQKNDYVKSYDNFIENYYNPDKYILLATATNIEDIKTIYNNHPNIIEGFGELKCYDTYMDSPVPYKKIRFVHQVCEFSSTVGNLPVYLHWEINNKSDCEKLKNLFEKFPNIPIVLCHCGMNEYNTIFALENAINFAVRYKNVWLDCTYTALTYLNNNIIKLLNMPKHKIILGSDINNKNFESNHNPKKEINNIINMNTKLADYIDSDTNIRKLFYI